MGHRLGPLLVRAVVSALIATLGLASAWALSKIDYDKEIIYREFSRSTTALGHLSTDVIRYRTTLTLAMEARTKPDFDRIMAALPNERTRIDNAMEDYAHHSSDGTARTGRSEASDVDAARQSLGQYFSAADHLLHLSAQLWTAGSAEERAHLRAQTRLYAANNVSPKVIQLSLAFDRLLETAGDLAKEARADERMVARRTRLGVVWGGLFIAALNLILTSRA